MAGLASKDLFKYEWRTEKFISQYVNQEDFRLCNNAIVTFHIDDNVVDHIKNRRDTSKVRLTGLDGTKYCFSDLLKTAEYGGKTMDEAYIKEKKALESLSSQIKNAKLESNQETLIVKIKNVRYEISDVVNTPGNPKSDFQLVDASNNALVWISHKDGTRPQAFRQWSGISAKHEPLIAKHPETKAFVKYMQEEYPKGFTPKEYFLFRPIEDEKLKMLSVYGKDYKYRGTYGPQNVTMVLQGDIKLIKQRNYYEIGAYHIYYNGDKVIGGYEPALTARYTNDRATEGINYSRLTISPINSRYGGVEV